MGVDFGFQVIQQRDVSGKHHQSKVFDGCDIIQELKARQSQWRYDGRMTENHLTVSNRILGEGRWGSTVHLRLRPSPAQHPLDASCMSVPLGSYAASLAFLQTPLQYACCSTATSWMHFHEERRRSARQRGDDRLCNYIAHAIAA